MHTVAKVMFAIGGLICIIGVVMGIGGAEAAEIDIENDATYSGTSGTWYHDNADLYIVYVKSNVNCESFSASMTDSEGSSGSMFTDNLEVYDCEDWEDTEDGEFTSAGWVTVDATGDFTMESSSTIYIIGGGEELGEAVGGAFAMLGGFGMICCGGFFIVLGGILALVLKGGQQQVVVVNQQPGMMAPAGQMVAPATTQMAQPQYQQQQYPPQGGV
jgi:hypothetical protein